MSNSQSQVLRIGMQIAIYEIKGLLGSNQSEIIYRAWNKRSDSMVIIKEFFPFEYAVRDEDGQSIIPNSRISEFVFEFGLSDFIQLNEKLLEIQHPGAQIAQNILELNQTAYLVVDDPKGKLLSNYLNNSEPYKEDELKNLAISLLETLHEFHKAGIVHGDIHPANILMKENGEPVLLNFATARQKFARYIEEPSDELHTGYASPEQYLSRGNIDASSDIYAMGAVLYRCIFGRDPESSETRMAEINKEKPDPLKPMLDKSDTGFSDEFLATVEWMLQLESSSRPQIATEVIPAFRKAKSDSKSVVSFFSEAKTWLARVMERGSKRKPFNVATLAVGILTSTIFGSVVTSWFLGHDETDHNILSSQDLEKQGETAFAEAVDGITEKGIFNKNIPDNSEKPTNRIMPTQEETLKENTSNKLINEYMEKAEDSFAKFYLITPPEGNAYFYYKQVLGIKSDHKGAIKGIEKIINQYFLLINKAINTDDKPLAKLYLNRITAISPKSASQKETIKQFNEILQGINPRPTINPDSEQPG